MVFMSPPERPDQKLRQHLRPSAGVVDAILDFPVVQVFLVAVADFFQAFDEVEGIVNGINDTIAVAVVCLVHGAGLEPELEAGAVQARVNDFVHDAAAVGVAFIEIAVPPPKRAGKDPRPAEQLVVVPDDVHGREATQGKTRKSRVFCSFPNRVVFSQMRQ